MSTKLLFLISVNMIFSLNCSENGISKIARDSVDLYVQRTFDIRNQRLVCPASIEELQEVVKKAAADGKKIAIVGEGKSQGGQTVSSDENSYRVSLKHINKMINLDVINKGVTIQAGATWRQLINYINPHGLAIKAMQSYSTFSIGGSLSVNVHGQDLVENPLIRTVQSFKLMMSDATIIDVSRTQNAELFGLVIGGYGLLGIVTEVTLELSDDDLMDRSAESVKIIEAREYFYSQLKLNPKIRFMSARLQLKGDRMFDNVLFITYQKSEKKDASAHILEENGLFPWRKWLMSLLGRLNMRYNLETYFNKRQVTVSRNNFMNSDIYHELPKDSESKKYILQEYFIPPMPHGDSTNILKFRQHVKKLAQDYNIRIYNLSARFIKKDEESKLSFAHHDACALVFFIEVPKNEEEYAKTVEWTRSLIDKALELNGTFYLPYQLIATQEQFEKAYPAWREFVALKKKYDPKGMFTNQLYEKYAMKD